MKKIFASSIAFLSSFAVVQAAAISSSVQTSGVTDVNSLAIQLKDYFNLAIELMIAAAVAWVIWSAFQFVLSAGNDEARGKARSGIVYGIIGIAVMLSVWGLVGLVYRSTGLGGSNAPSVVAPRVN